MFVVHLRESSWGTLCGQKIGLSINWWHVDNVKFVIQNYGYQHYTDHVCTACSLLLYEKEAKSAQQEF